VLGSVDEQDSTEIQIGARLPQNLKSKCSNSHNSVPYYMYYINSLYRETFEKFVLAFQSRRQTFFTTDALHKLI
jgi:hypothetical protein